MRIVGAGDNIIREGGGLPGDNFFAMKEYQDLFLYGHWMGIWGNGKTAREEVFGRKEPPSLTFEQEAVDSALYYSNYQTRDNIPWEAGYVPEKWNENSILEKTLCGQLLSLGHIRRHGNAGTGGGS